MIIYLRSPLHKEFIGQTICNEQYKEDEQVIVVQSGGTEGIFVSKVNAGEINLTRPIILVASGQSNSLAASLEILSYINQQGGKGEIQC